MKVTIWNQIKLIYTRYDRLINRYNSKSKHQYDKFLGENDQNTFDLQKTSKIQSNKRHVSAILV